MNMKYYYSWIVEYDSDINGRSYHFVETNANVTWYEADRECKHRYGMNLASIHNKQYMSRIHQYLKTRTIKHPIIYIGELDAHNLRHIGIHILFEVVCFLHVLEDE